MRPSHALLLLALTAAPQRAAANDLGTACLVGIGYTLFYLPLRNERVVALETHLGLAYRGGRPLPLARPASPVRPSLEVRGVVGLPTTGWEAVLHLGSMPATSTGGALRAGGGAVVNWRIGDRVFPYLLGTVGVWQPVTDHPDGWGTPGHLEVRGAAGVRVLSTDVYALAFEAGIVSVRGLPPVWTFTVGGAFGAPREGLGEARGRTPDPRAR